MLAIVGSARGDEEILYCLMRMGGSMERYVENGMGIDGWDSRSSRTEGVGVAEAELEILDLMDSSVVSSRIVAMFLRLAGAVIST